MHIKTMHFPNTIFKEYMKSKSKFEQLMEKSDNTEKVTLVKLTEGERLSRYSTAEMILAQTQKAVAILEGEIEIVNRCKETKLGEKEIVENEKYDRQEAINKCLLLCERFHLSTVQLRERRKGRVPLLIEDEFDVQYFFPALLKLFFDDIRPEEYTLSYAGSSTRMDFLLKTERIIIETKMASESHKDKKIGEELILDIAHYKEHPDCGALICLVYDPDYCIRNPSTLENDLLESNEEFQVIVKVIPKRA